MWLLLCSSTDNSALWAAGRLRARGLTPLMVLTPDLLHYSFQWEHRVRTDGATSLAFTLPDGSTIDGARVDGVLNRISFVPAHLLNHLAQTDRAYALQEWTALHMSWLASLRVPVLNLPVIEGLCGAWRHQSEWVWLAGQAGLDADAYRQGAPARATDVPHPRAGTLRQRLRTVVTIDGRGFNADVEEPVADACGRLGVLARTRLLGVEVDARGAFVSASPLPNLRAGGERVIDALAAALRGTAP